MALKQITAVSAIPAVPPSDPSLAASVFRVETGNAVEILGRATAGTGKAYLLRWRPEIAKWAPWGADAAGGYATIDSAAPAELAGWFAGRWATGESICGDFLVLIPVGPTIAELWGGRLRL